MFYTQAAATEAAPPRYSRPNKCQVKKGIVGTHAEHSTKKTCGRTV